MDFNRLQAQACSSQIKLGLKCVHLVLQVHFTLAAYLTHDGGTHLSKIVLGTQHHHHHHHYHCGHPNSTEIIIISVIIADFTFWKMVSGRTLDT